MRFRDRRDAGAKLACQVVAHPDIRQADPMVYALSRGGVPVAAEVAALVGAELDVWRTEAEHVPDVHGRAVVLVDEGLAAGTTAHDAVCDLRHRSPARLVVAVPVCSSRAAALVQGLVDELICLDRPWYFRSIADWYEDFHTLADYEVEAATHI